MAQVLKEEIRLNIERAALELFSEKGFASATMADIARRASISTGNVYNYYQSKEELFYSLITDQFVEGFLRITRSKMKTADGISLREALYYAPMVIRDQEVLDFFTDYRLHLIILLSRSAGTRYAGFRERFLEQMIGSALAYQKPGDQGGTRLSGVKTCLLRVIYDNLMNAVISILSSCNTAEEIAGAYHAFLEYHYQGIGEFLEKD